MHGVEDIGLDLGMTIEDSKYIDRFRWTGKGFFHEPEPFYVKTAH
jgi:hypothetical protein